MSAGFGLLTNGLITGPPLELLFEELVPVTMVVMLPTLEPAWVVMTRGADGGETVVLSSDDPLVATVPASVVFSEGEVAKSFDVTGVAVGSTTIRAMYGGVEKTIDVDVEPSRWRDFGLQFEVVVDSYPSLQVTVRRSGVG